MLLIDKKNNFSGVLELITTNQLRFVVKVLWKYCGGNTSLYFKFEFDKKTWKRDKCGWKKKTNFLKNLSKNLGDLILLILHV